MPVLDVTPAEAGPGIRAHLFPSNLENPMSFVVRRIALASFMVLTVAGAAAAQQAGGAAAQLRTACQVDAKKHCDGIQPGGGRLLQCLKGKQTELSPACQTALKSAPAR
jgi:hypothetical protein